MSERTRAQCISLLHVRSGIRGLLTITALGDAVDARTAIYCVVANVSMGNRTWTDVPAGGISIARSSRKRGMLKSKQVVSSLVIPQPDKLAVPGRTRFRTNLVALFCRA